MSKFDRNRIKDGWEKLSTNRQTDKLTDTTKITVTWPWTNVIVWVTYGGGSGMKFFKIILFQHGTTSEMK